MKYVVSLGLNKFKFDDASTAISFVEMAANYFVPTEYYNKLNAYISIEDDEEVETDE